MEQNRLESAISIIENEKKCVQSNCDRDCSRCELVKEEPEIVGAFDLAIHSLNAWEEVLNELENIYSDEHENKYGNGIHKAIDIIKRKLEGVTE